MTDHIHHLVPASDWPGLGHAEYRPPSLTTEGFIHFSTAEQLPATSRRHYAAVPNLLVVTVAVGRLRSELRWEDRSGHGVFPHLYGPLDTDAVVQVTPYRPGDPAPRVRNG